MDWDYQGFQDRLIEAVDRYDTEEVDELIDELIAYLHATNDPYPARDGGRILQLLRRKRFFAQLERAAEELLHSGDIPTKQSYKIRRLHAQALIDQGKLATAIALLEVLEQDTVDDAEENREARGLLGRAHKQAYVDAGGAETNRSRQDLEQSIDWYAGVYEADNEQVWHGINAVAVLNRAARDGVELPGRPDPRPIAETILTEIKNRYADQKADEWDFASAAEACVYLGENEEALKWTKRYVDRSAADAFELASTLRQFTEVWQLDAGEEPGRSLLPYLQAELLKRKGGRVDFEPEALGALADLLQEDDGTYETVLGKESFENVAWLKTALTRAASVAKVEDKLTNPKGTAFVVSAEDLGVEPVQEGELLLLTNSHVISDEGSASISIRSSDARINFEVDKLEKPLRVEPVIDESAVSDLDYTVFRTKPPLTDREPIPLAESNPELDERVYIIGHPSGGQLSFSIYDNRLLDDEPPYLHYRTPTEPGSSGSPVMDKSWDLIALHHVGNQTVKLSGKEQKANEGIQILQIVDRIGEQAT